jgi:predicted ArsR family transcriptional regulator
LQEADRCPLWKDPLVHGVRRQILELLKERNQATVAELAEWLGMAPVSVRHHLDILQGDNLICVERLDKRGNVGRPQQVYALTDEATSYFPNNFALLAATLVRQVKQVLPAEQVDAVFRSLAGDLAAEFEEDDNAPGAPLLDDADALEARVRRVAEFLNARGYLASYEAECADGPSDGPADSPASDADLSNACGGATACVEVQGDSFLLHKHNCPYAGLSDEHRELCLMDQTLVDTLFDRHCERISHMGEQDRCCTYRVRLEADSPGTLIAFEPTIRSVQVAG